MNTLQQHLEEQEKKFNEIKPVADIEIRLGEWLIGQDEAKDFLRQSNIATIKWVMEVIQSYIIENAKTDLQTSVNVRMRILLDELNKEIINP